MSALDMTLRDRIGVDLGGRRRLEDGLAWAAAHGVHYVDACLEGAPDHPNAPATWTADRVAALRVTCDRHRIHLGLHSASAVNVAPVTCGDLWGKMFRSQSLTPSHDGRVTKG